MLLLGHRGACRYAPENTFQAFDLALDHGCDGIEFDVRLTGDQEAVICHDARYKRCDIASCNYREPGPVSELPPLTDVLCRYGSRAFLYIELKVIGLEQRILTTLGEHPPERGYVVSSFLPETLERFYALDGRVPLGLIAGKESELARWRDIPCQWVMARKSLIGVETVQMLHQSGKKIFAWTVNSERAMRAMAVAGVDGLLSDDTALAARVFGRRSQAAFAH